MIVTAGLERILLFSYGTLQKEEVQLANFGRRLEGEADAALGYRLCTVEIGDPAVIAASGSAMHPIIVATGDPIDAVAGTLFVITEFELAAADAYEVAAYTRVEVLLRSGRRAWAYAEA